MSPSREAKTCPLSVSGRRFPYPWKGALGVWLSVLTFFQKAPPITQGHITQEGALLAMGLEPSLLHIHTEKRFKFLQAVLFLES